ncbi:MAG: hypothetical protein NZM11_09260 [Anaerolineales bacterium]|nr:hypothetical protein [Anaerolineales bacterium]
MPNLLSDKRLRVYFILAAIILGGVLLCSTLIIFFAVVSPLIEAQAITERLRPLQTVCENGAAVPEAPEYIADPGPNKVVVYLAAEDETYYNRIEDYPRHWHATTVGEAELVACAQTGKQIIETCEYTLEDEDNTLAKLQREQYTLTVRLYAPHTGELLAETVLTGSEPRACQDTETFTDGVTTQTVTGDPIKPAEMTKWLQAYVEP